MADEKGNDIVRMNPNDIIITSLKYLNDDVIKYVKSCHNEIYLYADESAVLNKKENMIKEIDGVIVDDIKSIGKGGMKFLTMDMLLKDIGIVIGG